jgi:hypothetical protein
MCGPAMLPGVEVSCPKTIDIKQYLSTSNLSVNNRHFVVTGDRVLTVQCEETGN